MVESLIRAAKAQEELRERTWTDPSIIPDSVKVTQDFLDKAAEMCKYNHGEWYSLVFGRDHVAEDFSVPFQQAGQADVDVDSKAVFDFLERTIIDPPLTDIYGREIIGWLHSHAGFSTFLSEKDWHNIGVLRQEIIGARMEPITKVYHPFDGYTEFDFKSKGLKARLAGWVAKKAEPVFVEVENAGWMYSIVVNNRQDTYQELHTNRTSRFSHDTADQKLELEIVDGEPAVKEDMEMITENMVNKPTEPYYFVDDFTILPRDKMRAERCLQTKRAGKKISCKTPVGDIESENKGGRYKVKFGFPSDKWSFDIQGTRIGFGFSLDGSLVVMTENEVLYCLPEGAYEQFSHLGIPPKLAIMQSFGDSRGLYVNNHSFGYLSLGKPSYTFPLSLGPHGVIEDEGI